MSINVLMPALSPTMTQGNLVRWLKKEGEKISPGQIMAEIETDKAIMEVEAVDSGILGKIIVPENTFNVNVNEVIAILLEKGEGEKELQLALEKLNQKSEINDQKVKESNLENALNTKTNIVSDNNAKVTESGTHDNQRVMASPLAKVIAKQNQVDLKFISGSGPHGRIIKNDVLFAIDNNNQKITKSNLEPINIDINRNNSGDEIIQMSGMRRTIGKRLLESKQSIPHFYLNIEVSVDKLLELRASINSQSTDLSEFIKNKKLSQNSSEPIKISVNDMVIKACAMALKQKPEANIAMNDDQQSIIKFKNVDISIAVAINDGLITPIIKNADQKSIFHISTEMKQLSQKAKENKLSPTEFQGGGFTISNLGMYNIDQFQAIVNPPQASILAVGGAVKKAVIDNNNQIVIGHRMNCTLSCDHRILDGALAAEFLQILRYYIENPILLFT